MADRAPIGVLISGRGSNMAALLYASRAADCPFEIALVLSNDPDAPGLALAKAEGVATVARDHRGTPRAAFDQWIDGQLRAAGCTHVALAGYMRLLSPGFVEKWSNRIVNMHPALLPLYPGLHTHEAALAAGDRHAGCTVHIVTEALDDGPILGQTRVAILPGDTADTLAARVLIAEHQLYPRCLAALVTRETTPDYLLGRVRELAMTLPDAAEKLSHGMPAFHVSGGKMFAYFTQDHHGDGKTAIIVKTSGPDEAAMLIDNDPDLYYRPAYFGATGWVGLRLDQGEADWDRVADRLQRSWAAIAPAKLRALAEFLS